MTPKAPRVSIVILNWNGVQETVRCLKSLAQLKYPNFRIVVLDNGSRKDEASEIRPHLPGGSLLLKSPKNLGFSGGVNYCLKYLREKERELGGYYLLLNNDTEVPEGTLQKLVEAGESDSSLGILGPKILAGPGSAEPPLLSGWIRWYTGTTPFEHEAAARPWVECELVHGCCFLIKAEVVEKIGYLDEQYFAYYEETDYCARAARAGYRVAVVPQAEIVHEGSVSVKKVSGMQEYLMMRNRLLFVRKNGTTTQFASTLLYSGLVYGARRSARAVIKGEWKLLPALLRGYASGVLGTKVSVG